MPTGTAVGPVPLPTLWPCTANNGKEEIDGTPFDSTDPNPPLVCLKGAAPVLALESLKLADRGYSGRRVCGKQKGNDRDSPARVTKRALALASWYALIVVGLRPAQSIGGEPALDSSNQSY